MNGEHWGLVLQALGVSLAVLIPGVIGWKNLSNKLVEICTQVRLQKERSVECRKTLTDKTKEHSTLIHDCRERLTAVETQLETETN